MCNCCRTKSMQSLQWRHNGRDGVSDHQPYHCLLNRLFMRRSKKTSNSASLAFVRGINRRPVNSPQKWPVTQKKVSIWWHHHDWNPSKQQGSGRNISYNRLTTQIGTPNTHTCKYQKSITCMHVKYSCSISKQPGSHWWIPAISLLMIFSVSRLCVRQCKTP